MLMHLPYAYDIRCVSPGRRVESSHEVMGVAAFEVRDVSSVDAPVACSQAVDHRTYEGGSYVSLRVSPDGFAEQVRAMRATRGWCYQETIDADVLGRFDDPVTRTCKPFGRPTEEGKIAEILASASRGRAIKDLTDDSEGARARAARTWADGFLVVDGTVWVRSTEPHLRLELEGRHVVLASRTGASPGARWSVGFAADRHGEAVAQGRRIAAARRGRGFRDESHHRPIDVTGHAPLAFDEADDMASGIVDELSYGFRYPEEHGHWGRRLTERREARDPTWAHDFLDIEGLDRDMRYSCRREKAADKVEFSAACAMSVELWRTSLRAHALSRVAEPEEEPALLAFGA